jgi:hypothetical protein
VKDLNVLSRSNPVACLSCCLLRGSQAEAERQITTWAAEFASKQSDLLVNGYGWHGRIPWYVLRLFTSLEEPTIGGPNPEWDAPGDIQAVMVVDLRHSG